MNRIATSLGRLQMHSPVTVASGTFGTQYFDFFDQDVLGAYVSKTITLHPKEGNPPPRLFETEAGLLNSIGLQNPGLDGFMRDDLPELRSKLRIPLIVSFSGATEDEFCRILESLEGQEGIDGYEVNISCPNVENEGITFGADPDIVHSLTQKLAGLTDRELIIKLSPNVADICRIAQAAEEGGATSLALINTLYGMAIDPQTGISRISQKVCGYSGRGIKPIALAMTYKAAQVVSIPILSMGGINSWRDALEFFYAGASAVAVGSAFFGNPLAAKNIVEGLKKYLEEKELVLWEIMGKVR